jgi:hypothetical protein
MFNIFNNLGGLLDTIGYGLLLVFLLLSLVVPYVVLRLRDGRNELHDPQIGLKVVLHFFFSVGWLLGLTGLSVIIADILRSEIQFLSEAQRNGAAFLLSGLAFAILHYLLLRYGSNNGKWPATGRLYTGWRLAIHGIVVLAAITYLLQLLFQRDPPALEAKLAILETERTLYAILLVWGLSWVLHLGWIWWLGTRADTPATGVTWEAKEA